MRKLKIYTDLNAITEGKEVHWTLPPLLADQQSSADRTTSKSNTRVRGDGSDMLAEYYAVANTIAELVQVDQCDVAVFPVDWRDVRGGLHWLNIPDKAAVRSALDFHITASSAGKPVTLFFSGSRSHEKVPLKNAYVFRNALYRSRRKKTDFAMPVFFPDILQGHFDGNVAVRPKRPKPIVGFCGFSRDVTLREHLKTVVYHIVMLAKYRHPDVSQYKGLALRQECLRILGESSAVKTNFIVRDRSVFLTKEGTKEQKQKLRDDFVRNMAESDYQLCVRGSANHSRRPWEALCCGRIPIFIDTDCVLPFEGHIDWKHYCVLVDEKDIDRLPETVADFHAALSNEDFEELQLACRKIWVKWLSPQGFMCNLYRHFNLAS